MATKEQIIAKLKTEHPTLKTGSDETGYTDLNLVEYEATIEGWADYQLANEAKAAADGVAAKQAEADKATATAKLEALGLTTDDLKALGLGSN